MINLDGMTFAQKVYTLKWAQYEEQKQPKRREPIGGQYSEACEAMRAKRRDKTNDPNSEYWLRFMAVYNAGGSITEAWQAAEKVWVGKKATGRYKTYWSAKKSFLKFRKHNNIPV